MIKEINRLTFGMTVSGKNVIQRKFFSCLAQAMATCKKWHRVIFT